MLNFMSFSSLVGNKVKLSPKKSVLETPSGGNFVNLAFVDHLYAQKPIKQQKRKGKTQKTIIISL